jgi:hypothetical protein
MGLSSEVTLRTLQLVSADSVTGWYTKNYSESTIDMIIVSKGTQQLLIGTGTYVRLDRLGFCIDPVYEGDQIEDSVGGHYEVEAVREHWLLDSLVYREVDLTLLPLEELTGGSYTESTVEDARYRTKVFLQTYLDSDYLPNYLVAYGEPDYPMTQVFKIKGIDLIFSIGEPETKPLIDARQGPYGYEENMPITIFSINKSNLDGTKVKWQAETEFRRLLQENPTGSLRQFERRRNADRDLGSTRIYGTEWIMTYERDLT